MSIPIKTREQIDGIRRAGKLAAAILDHITPRMVVGQNGKEIERECQKQMQIHNATSATLGYRGFPGAVCISPNEVVCHGIPNEQKFQNGDIINVDITVILDGFYGDTSRMFCIGDISSEAQLLVETTQKAMMRGIEEVFPGNFLSNIGFYIQKTVEKRGFSVVRDYCGHGVGLAFHEAPEVLHYGRKNRGPLLKPGMIFTIEPMINIGTYEVTLDKKDNWTVRSRDMSLSAQFEHTVLVTQTGYEILT